MITIASGFVLDHLNWPDSHTFLVFKWRTFFNFNYISSHLLLPVCVENEISSFVENIKAQVFIFLLKTITPKCCIESVQKLILSRQPKMVAALVEKH